MQDKLYNTTIALAGIIQAISLVKELAQTGKVDEIYFNASIQSIFQTEPKDTLAVYGKLPNIKRGLEELLSLFQGDPKHSRSLMRYLISIIHLQRKIQRSPQLLKALAQRVNQAKKQSEYFGSPTHSNVIINLADIYMSTISKFKFRIMIWGNPRVLHTSGVMEKIRALLLSGIRSSVLWKQNGGSRLQLLFSRSKIKTMTQKILSEIHRIETYEKETS